jgi:hypothetical protein
MWKAASSSGPSPDPLLKRHLSVLEQTPLGQAHFDESDGELWSGHFSECCMSTLRGTSSRPEDSCRLTDRRAVGRALFTSHFLVLSWSFESCQNSSLSVLLFIGFRVTSLACKHLLFRIQSRGNLLKESPQKGCCWSSLVLLLSQQGRPEGRISAFSRGMVTTRGRCNMVAEGAPGMDELPLPSTQRAARLKARSTQGMVLSAKVAPLVEMRQSGRVCGSLNYGV